MLLMKHVLLAVSLYAVAANAQLTNRQMDMPSGSLFMMDVTGIPYRTKEDNLFISGSVFYNDAWQKGVAVTSSGGRTKPFLGKLNLLTNQLHYLNASGQEYIAESALKELTFLDSITGSAVRFVRLPDDSKGQELWYQELDTTGKAKLYKLYRKKHVEQKLYNSATTEHAIETTESFYLKQPTGIQQIKSTKDLIESLPDGRNEMESFIRRLGRGQKLEEKLTKAVQHYNSLPASSK